VDGISAGMRNNQIFSSQSASVFESTTKSTDAHTTAGFPTASQQTTSDITIRINDSTNGNATVTTPITIETASGGNNAGGSISAPGGVTIPQEYTTTNSKAATVVNPTGLLDAGTDFQNGIIGPTTLLDVGTAFQNSP
jgi:hypothetical protein